MGVFAKDHNPETSLKRNTFPQSFLNNLTFNFGQIIPFFVQETLSGDTFELDTSLGLRFLPTVFPLQNRIRCDVHYFYVRDRNVYDEYKEWYTGGTYDKPMPFLDGLKPDFFENGKLADYFNIPTNIFLSEGDSFARFQNGSVLLVPTNPSPDGLSFPYHSDGSPITNKSSDLLPVVGDKFYNFFSLAFGIGRFPKVLTPLSTVSSLSSPFFAVNGTPFNSSLLHVGFRPSFDFLGVVNTGGSTLDFYYCPIVLAQCTSKGQSFYLPIPAGTWQHSSVPYEDSYDYGSENFDCTDFSFEDFMLTNFPDTDLPIGQSWRDFVSEIKVGSCYVGYCCISGSSSQSFEIRSNSASAYDDLVSIGSYSLPLSSFPESSNPFINGKVPLNALPFRAYEQIYNSFFRDERNNPLLINGKPYYDKYLPTTSGGADTTLYELRRRNWEQDFLTTALPSPQQGQAPLVGISATGVMSLSDESGNVYQAQAITADDADTIIGAKFIKTNQDGTTIPTEVARSLVSYATSGISINDFRNVNALQRYLETNLRRGLKYRDLVAARWGVNISYSEMNMPEFIGGMTEYVNPVQVNQQSQGTDTDPLGSYAGQLYCQGKQKHKIRHFCDEAGFIIGVVSVVPVPVYSQLLPKIFTKFDQLDFFNPEFGHIGMQPIPMKEVAPLQVASQDGNQDETFGYQRAWYDYLARVDEVHGQFRGSLRDFVMYRTFNGIPRLSEDFLLVDNKPLDNVFSVQTDADGNSIDKILGQIYVDCVARRPIPRFGIPKLE
ncbi:major capsid protein [Peromfec virus RodF8_10]|uniref:Major capsid protein n=1 Tax=Peromfec virus RodF8_10 TaxID=2929357 RepID=A0A976N2Y0_9VIRU|nr:major capsid protein [Peromfec virus RodF8_10]